MSKSASDHVFGLSAGASFLRGGEREGPKLDQLSATYATAAPCSDSAPRDDELEGLRGWPSGRLCALPNLCCERAASDPGNLPDIRVPTFRASADCGTFSVDFVSKHPSPTALAPRRARRRTFGSGAHPQIPTVIDFF